MVIDNELGTLSWCQKDECEKKLQRQKEHDENLKFAKNLEQIGHTCVNYRNQWFPVRIVWCQQEICNGIPDYGKEGNAE